jgi:hypothetical protein
MNRYISHNFLDARPRNGLKVSIEPADEPIEEYPELNEDSYIGAGDRVFIDDPKLPGIIEAWFLKGI